MLRFVTKWVIRGALISLILLAAWTIVVHVLPYPEWEVAAASLNMDGNIDIFVLDWRTGHRIRLTHESIDEMNPDWSPDGTKIAYLYGSLPSIMEVKNRHRENIKVFPLASSLDWSPDGKRILVSSLVNHQVLIFDGTDQIAALHVETGAILSPQWSPDGEWIVFADLSDIYIIRLSDFTAHNLTGKLDDHFYAPRWSPDSSRISFLSQQGLYVINREADNFRQLTTYPVQFVAWLSDGKHLIFYNEFEKSLYQMNVDEMKTNRVAFQNFTEQIISLDFRVVR